jgi:hypothetical protein
MRQLNENFSTLYLKNKPFLLGEKLEGRGTYHPLSSRVELKECSYNSAFSYVFVS